jgi:hypothetical protein
MNDLDFDHILIIPSCYTPPSSQFSKSFLQVSVYGMADMTDEQVASALREAVRVLKPGKVFYFHTISAAIKEIFNL